MDTYESIINVKIVPQTVPAISAEGVNLPAVNLTPVTPQSELRTQLQGDSVRKWKISPPRTMPWSLVKELELIKMTPYSVGEIKVTNYTALMPSQSVVTDWNSIRKRDGTCVFTGHYFGYARWDEQVSLMDVLGQKGIPLLPADAPDYSKELNEAMSNVVNKSMNGFDLLTNLAEFPEALDMIIAALKAARNPLKSAKEALEKYKKSQRVLRNGRDPNKLKKLKALDSDFRNQWLQYRYGIMPLVYSIQDALKLLDQSLFKFHTVHSGATVPVHITSRPMFDVGVGSYVYQTISGSISIRTTGKAKYGTASSRLSDLITFNPFLTAWELIPLSFVVDWFINVGDTVFSKTSALVDISEQRVFCYSVKKELTTLWTLHTSYDASIHLVAPPNPTYCVTALDEEFPMVVSDYHNMRNQTEKSYERVLFNPTDIEFQFNPSLGWERKLDAYALSFSTITKLLRKLK